LEFHGAVLLGSGIGSSAGGEWGENDWMPRSPRSPSTMCLPVAHMAQREALQAASLMAQFN
jgi:hypothetical protein